MERHPACFGTVKVTTQVVSHQRKALWFVIDEKFLSPGSLHAAEHASIGMLPLVATSDRWDIGGVSTALHADTEKSIIFVYDGHPGGAGFAERGYEAARI